MSTYICCLCNHPNSEVEVTVQKCNHVICWECLHSYVTSKLDVKIKCPSDSCTRFLSDNAIRKVLSDEDEDKYDQLLMGKVKKNVKCLLEGCNHVYICVDLDVQFDCPECTLFTCLPCNAAHKYLTCEQYRSEEDAQNYCKTEIERATINLMKRKRKAFREIFIEMDQEDLLIHDKVLVCQICCRNLAKGDAVILRCYHIHCRYCLHEHINDTPIIPIMCPSDQCKKPLEEREISKLITTEELEIYIDRCNSRVKGTLEFTFQCQSANCVYFVEYTIKPGIVRCPLCKVDNCTACYAIHTNETCAQFKDRIKSTPEGKNLLRIEERIRNHELMRCLKCHQILEKIKGCSWIQCSNCKFEMCWALQMRRWGPKGRGDETGGCKCKVNGEYCVKGCGSCIPHPSA